MIRQYVNSPVESLGNIKTINDFLKPKPDVQYFDEWKGELTHSQRHKADQFLGLNLIQYNGKGEFLCLPIEGYNQPPTSCRGRRGVGHARARGS